MFLTLCMAALFKQLVRACECAAGFGSEVSLLHDASRKPIAHPFFGMLVRTPPGCPTASPEAMPNTPSRCQVHPISNDTQLAMPSSCAARKALKMNAAQKLLVCRNVGPWL